MEKENKKSKKESKAQQKADIAAGAFIKSSSFESDPYGCYTGKSRDEDKVPIQDADDL